MKRPAHHVVNRGAAASARSHRYSPRPAFEPKEPDRLRRPQAGPSSLPCLQRPSKEQGFTLIELMVVIVILGILAGLIVPRIMGRPDEAKQLKARMQIESLESALKLYKLDNGRYPNTEEGLEALVAPPETGNSANWREGGYLEKQKVPNDPWGNGFVYLAPGQHSDFDLMSYGADGVAGGEGRDTDINNWEID